MIKPTPPPLYFTHYKPTPDYPTHAETAMEAQQIYQKAMAEWEMKRSCDKYIDTDQDDFKECSECDGHDACADFGCAIKLGLGYMIKVKKWDK